MFRLQDRGAKFKCKRASSFDVPSSDDNLVWNACNDAITLSHAWYIERCDIPDKRVVDFFYRFTNSPSVKYRTVRNIDVISYAASLAKSTTAFFIDNA